MDRGKHSITHQFRRLTRFFPRLPWLYRAPANEPDDDPVDSSLEPLDQDRQDGPKEQLDPEEQLHPERQAEQHIRWLEPEQEVEDQGPLESEQPEESEQQPEGEQPLENEGQGGDRVHQCSMQALLPHNLSREQFQKILDRYQSYIRDVYQRADSERFLGIPQKIKEREEPYIDKTNLIYLDQWMQKRGKPLKKEAHLRNRKYIEKNSEEDIRAVTSKAFKKYENSRDVLSAMDILVKGLQGVGPSRASLILSTAFPDSLPYFSRGLYQWTHWDEDNGWGQEFKWTSDKYRCVLQQVTALVESHSVRDRVIRAVDVEKVAFVLEHESCIRDFQMDSITDDLIGETKSIGFGRANVYRVDRRPIDGSQGVVALKQIYKSKDVTSAKNRFLAEVTSSHHLWHKSPEHFVEFIGWNGDRNSLFIAMEYIELGDLEHCIGIGRWAEKAIKETTKQILEGLKIMHQEGIAHRDLKPQNILVVSTEPNIKVKITDFGLSKRLSNRKTSGLVSKGIGTAGYKAPEVVRLWDSEDSSQDLNHYSRHSYTFKADIWSLGCIIIRMAVGKQLRLFRSDHDLINDPVLHKKVGSIKSLLGEANPAMGKTGIEFVQKLIVIEEATRCDSEGALKELNNWEISKRGK
ncbi:kinase-like protein [Daldinia eschscholtzii]|nr:kinase-like protein [Daldinia eschscholtzii]